MAAGRSAALAGQAVRPGLVVRPGLGPQATGPGHPGRGGGRDAGPLPGALRSADGPLGRRAMSDPALLVRARRLRAARGVVVARDVTLAAAPGDVVAVEG